jgi:hypothetical protein
MNFATNLLRMRLNRSRRSSRSIRARILQIVFSSVAPLILSLAIAAFYIYQNERDHIMVRRYVGHRRGF